LEGKGLCHFGGKTVKALSKRSRQGSSLVCSIIKPLACKNHRQKRTSQRLDNTTHQAGALAQTRNALAY